MAEAIEIAVDEEDGHVVEPPIIDSLHKDKGRRTWNILFVPEESVSSHEKEHVTIAFSSTDGRRIQTRMDRLEKLFGKPIDRIYHGGGGHFTLHFQRSKRTANSRSGNEPATSFRAYVELTDIAMTAQIAFLSSRLAAAG